MSSPEAAASLFGSEGDSGPDPFAVIGNVASDTTPPGDSEHEPTALSYPSQMGQDTSSWLAEQMYPDTLQEQQDPWLIPTAQDAPSRQTHSGLSRDHQQGCYPEAPHSMHAPPPVALPPYQSMPSSYDSYASARPVPQKSYNPNQVSVQQPPYDPYRPTTTTSLSSPYVPRQAVKQSSVQSQAPQHNNYSPAARTVLSSAYTAPFTVSPQPPPNGTLAQPSKPPAPPTAAEFRPKASNAYDPPFPPPKVNRAVSPSSLRSIGNSQRLVSHVPQLPPTNPNDTKFVPGLPRTMSPSSIRSISPTSSSLTSSKNISVFPPSQPRGRSASNGSTLSSQGAIGSHQPRKEYGLGFGAHIAEPNIYGGQSSRPVEHDVDVLRATRPPYAPSPSLLGSNDPLGRTSSRAPVISFGFGGKVLTCFHGSADLNTGFDIALSSRRTANVAIRVLHQLLPDYVPESKDAEYPGPLFSDPGVPITSLVRSGTSQAKTKKARVIQYLEGRAEEISRATMYISDNSERQRLEGKLVLVQLLKIMVENDGSLSGSPAIDNAVRAALSPSIVGDVDQPRSVTLAAPALTSTMPNAYGATSVLSPVKEIPISVSTLFPSTLDKIQELLVRGERRQAYRYALDERLWAHAMVIANGVDKEAWTEVVNEFLRTELGVHENLQYTGTHLQAKGVAPRQTNGREWLRVAYSVFSGQGPTAVQELVPMNLLSRTVTSLPASILPHSAPTSPNFTPTPALSQVPPESLSKWPEIAASIVSSPLNPEYSATLSALGDCLASHHLVEGAHVCYLLSPQTSMMGGLSGPSTRLALLGSQSPHINPVFFRDLDPVIFTEIAEFALSLKTPTKGQEPFHGLPHLQAYKFIRATYLADIGHIQSATRYCEAITAVLSRPSPYFTPVLIEGLRQLADRLLGSSHMDRSTSWMGGKVNKPSLDSIGSWLEVHLTKFIAGEGGESSPPAGELSNSQFAGPFSSYSSISSATTSASPSPPTIVASTTRPPRRSGSAMALPSTTMHAPVDRASSAMEYYRPMRHASPTPKTAPLHSPLHSTEYHYAPFSVQTSVPSTVNGYAAPYGSEPSSRKTSLEMTAEEASETQNDLRDGQYEDDQQQPTAVDESGGWWNSLSNTDSAPTPTTTTFHQIESARELGEGFISLMDDPALSTKQSVITPSHQGSKSVYEDDADDLGLGNRAHRGKQDEPAKMTEEKPPVAPVQNSASDDGKQESPLNAPAGSWLSWIWKRSDNPGPIKASLGEETSFYYDKELKCWVNKKAGKEAPQGPAPPPPPLRAQTASPSMSNSRFNGMSNGAVARPQPPPPRTASAIDLSTSPTSIASTRSRSLLAPTEVTSLPNTPAPSGTLNAPPMGRTRSQAAKKNVRSRYVDVFQQNGTSGAV